MSVVQRVRRFEPKESGIFKTKRIKINQFRNEVLSTHLCINIAACRMGRCNFLDYCNLRRRKNRSKRRLTGTTKFAVQPSDLESDPKYTLIYNT